MTEAFISPPVLSWARGRLRASDTALAAAVNVTVDRLRAWEGGSSRPTLRQAQRLADSLRLPLGYLYLEAPPAEALPLPDRRTIALRDHPTPSADLLDIANAVKRKQDWYREYRLTQSAAAVSLVGSYRPGESPTGLAASIRNALGLAIDHYRESRSWTAHLARLVRKAEALGILVFRSGIVAGNTHRSLDVTEFRGLAFSDPIAPAVFINSRDAVAAQIFTLVHELAHLWIGESAAIDADAGTEPEESQSEVERFCDRAATEFLVPESEFVRDWDRTTNLEEAVQALPQRYRVSSVMILRRAYEMGLVPREQYLKRLVVEKRLQTPPGKRGGGGNYYSNFSARNGRLLIGGVYESVTEGRTLYREAAAILELKVGTLARLIAESPLARNG